MFKIDNVATKRGSSPSINYDLIYEWEDIICEKMNLPLLYENNLVYNKCIRLIPGLASLIQTSKNVLMFDIYPNIIGRGNNKPNIIPIIVDFYLKDEKSLNRFYESYKNNPLVLISSREAYDFLKKISCPLNIKHLALSISDKYQLSNTLGCKKDIDLILLGRRNKVLQEYAELYAKQNPDFVYAYRVNEKGHWLCKKNNGEIVSNIDNRRDYMKTMMRARCGLYNTPGIDGGEARTNGFSQVTPRFLEYIASGCHVISRYRCNSDTDYYELDSMTCNVDSYDEFKTAMDFSRSNNIDAERYSNYLSKHYTSSRIVTLNNILKGL